MNKKEHAKSLHKKRMTLSSRYLFIRYSLATFFFANLNWLLMGLFTQSLTILFPLVLLLCSLPALFEQMKLFANPTLRLDKTLQYYRIQFIAQFIIIMLCATPWFELFFPILSSTTEARMSISGIALIGLLILLRLQKRIHAIHNNTDTFYLQFKELFK